MTPRMQSQMNFLRELERLKGIYRRNKIFDRSRAENSAEHSWHVAMMAFILLEHAEQSQIDIWKVVKMLLIHDVVEIYAGDTWAYDQKASLEQQNREEVAASKLFSLLPADQREDLYALHREFNERGTPEANFAASIDALQPLVNHLVSGRRGDDFPAPSREDVLQRKCHIQKSSQTLWKFAKDLIEASVEQGLYT